MAVKEAFEFLKVLAQKPSNGWLAILALALGFHTAWSAGWLNVFGIKGFAVAGEVDTVKTELRKEIVDSKNEMTGQINAVKAELNLIQAQQNASLRILMAQEICRIYRLREQSIDRTLTAQLSESFEQKQIDYQRLGNPRYPVAECAPNGR